MFGSFNYCLYWMVFKSKYFLYSWTYYRLSFSFSFCYILQKLLHRLTYHFLWMQIPAISVRDIIPKVWEIIYSWLLILIFSIEIHISITPWSNVMSHWKRFWLRCLLLHRKSIRKSPIFKYNLFAFHNK